MAIVKSFNGQSIRKPGAYSRFKVDNSAGAPLGSNSTLFLVGEAAKGAPGSTTGVLQFQAEQLNDLIALYGSGPIVDAAVASVRPSNTPGVGGAGRILVWKTNASTQAEADLTIDTGGSDLYNVKDRAYGEEGNDLQVIVEDGDTSDQKAISVSKLADTTEDLGQNAAQNVLSIQYTGDASTAELTISGASRAALALSTTLAGDQTDGSADLSITLSDYTMKQLVDFINSQTGYTASLETSALAVTDAEQLDPVSIADVKTSASNLKRLQYEILDLLNSSERIEATIDTSVIEEGLLDNQTGLSLTGGAQGASTNQDFSDGFSQSLANDYNVLLPCVSRDASEDISDADLGFTDAASTYTIASVIAAADAHLTTRSSTKNRKEAQGMVGIRKSAKQDAFDEIAGIGSYFIQAAMQDVVVLDATGNARVKLPHVFAALCAGIRLGTSVGEPLTHKFLKALQVGHVINPNTLLEDGDFNPGTDADTAIDAGVLFSEPKNNGYRIVVDNTTYGQDQSFVFNRGSVIEASQFVYKTLRETAELVFVGQKVSNGLASSIKTTVRNKLRELNQPDVQIITSSDDAPEGFVEETFVVTVSGNTANVQVEFKPVQGLDFVFFNFTLGDIQQSA
jgi:hypothetical protein